MQIHAIKIVDGKIFSHIIERQRGHWSYFRAVLSTLLFSLQAGKAVLHLKTGFCIGILVTKPRAAIADTET